MSKKLTTLLILQQMNMSSLNILIIESNLLNAIQLEITLQTLDYYRVQKVDNIVAALSILKAQSIDLILADIDSTKQLDLLKLEKETIALNIPLIYTTASISNAQQNLTHPINKTILRTAIKAAISALSILPLLSTYLMENILSQNALYYQKQANYYKVDLHHILYIKATTNHSIITTKNNEHLLLPITLEQLINNLPQTIFLKVHPNHIININYIDIIDTATNIIQIQKVDIPFCPTQKSILLSTLQLAN